MVYENIEDYLKELISRGKSKDLSLGSESNPQNLRFNRRNYEFSGNLIVIGADKNVAEAREQRKKNLEKKFADLAEDPMNVSRLLDYSGEMLDDFYYKIAEEMAGRALSIDPRNIHAFHLLSRINLDYSRFNKKLRKKYGNLSEQLAQRGLEYIDAAAVRLVEDKLDAMSQQGKEWGVFQDKLKLKFSTD